jgi:hypothetical protein
MNVVRELRRWLSGERRRISRESRERVLLVNRQYEVARKLARRTGTTPEALMDYHRADQILGGHR